MPPKPDRLEAVKTNSTVIGRAGSGQLRGATRDALTMNWAERLVLLSGRGGRAFSCGLLRVRALDVAQFGDDVADASG